MYVLTGQYIGFGKNPRAQRAGCRLRIDFAAHVVKFSFDFFSVGIKKTHGVIKRNAALLDVAL